jgi:hypothetical protein
MPIAIRRAAMASALFLLSLSACSSSSAPSSHTVSKDGVMHMPGLTNPTTNCVSCHGSDLKGGSGPSCFSCHAKKW